MSLGCAGCGDCCDGDLFMNVPLVRLILENRDDHANDARALEDADFIAAHWTPDTIPDGDGWAHHTCDRFDPERRRCTDYENRPPVCRDFPNYPSNVRSDRARVQRMPLRCSYQLDYPPELRRDGARPLIPLEVLRG